MSRSLIDNDPKTYTWPETGTAVFATLNIVPASISVILAILLLFFTLPVPHAKELSDLWLSITIFLALLVMFVFSSLLFVGVCQEIPNYVLAYIIFGVIVEVLLVLAIQAHRYGYLPSGRRIFALEFIRFIMTLIGAFQNVIIGICVVYAMVLLMIIRAWRTMRAKRYEDDEKGSSSYL